MPEGLVTGCRPTDGRQQRGCGTEGEEEGEAPGCGAWHLWTQPPQKLCALSVCRTIFVWGKHAWERVPTRIRCAAGRGRLQERSEGAGVPKQHLSAGRAAARHRQQPRSTARGAGARQHAHLHHLCRFPAPPRSATADSLPLRRGNQPHTCTVSCCTVTVTSHPAHSCALCHSPAATPLRLSGAGILKGCTRT